VTYEEIIGFILFSKSPPWSAVHRSGICRRVRRSWPHLQRLGTGCPPTTSGKVVNGINLPSWPRPPMSFTAGTNPPSMAARKSPPMTGSAPPQSRHENPLVGSFLGFNGSDPTPVCLSTSGFTSGMTCPRVPGHTFPFSHPSMPSGRLSPPTLPPPVSGKDYDPRTGTFEPASFSKLTEYAGLVLQNPANGTNIYWISIAADYPTGAARISVRLEDPARDPNSPRLMPPSTFLTPPLPSSVPSSSTESHRLAGVNSQWDLAFRIGHRRFHHHHRIKMGTVCPI